MSSPQYSRSPFRHGSFLLLQDEPRLAPKGHGALASLIRERSLAPSPRDQEEGLGDDGVTDESRRSERRMSAILNAPHMRSMRLIGNSNPRYRWERYWKTQEELVGMRKEVRRYYERVNYLIQQYLYIDRLLDSSLPHDLLNEYNTITNPGLRPLDIPDTVSEEGGLSTLASYLGTDAPRKVKRTPKDIYRPTETTPLFSASVDDVVTDVDEDEDEDEGPRPEIPWLEDDQVDSDAPVVTLAIYINFAANLILLLGKAAVVASVPSVSVLASLVDAVLDFLSTVIVSITTFLVGRRDQYRYPVGRRRLEPIGVLVFSVIMITSFVQVGIEAMGRLASPNHELIELFVKPYPVHSSIPES